MKLKTLIVDDHDFFRKTLRKYLEELRVLDIIGEACNGREAVDHVEISLPQLVLMDINMPELDGLNACRIIKETYPDIKVVLYTMHDPKLYSRASHNLADVFMGKDRLFEELPEVLDRIGNEVPGFRFLNNQGPGTRR